MSAANHPAKEHANETDLLHGQNTRDVAVLSNAAQQQFLYANAFPVRAAPPPPNMINFDNLLQ